MQAAVTAHGSAAHFNATEEAGCTNTAALLWQDTMRRGRVAVRRSAPDSGSQASAIVVTPAAGGRQRVPC